MNHRSFMRANERNRHFQDMLRNSYVQRHSEENQDYPRGATNNLYEDQWDAEWDTGESAIYMDEAGGYVDEEPLSEDDEYLERMGIAL